MTNKDTISTLRSNLLQLQSDLKKKNERIETQKVIIKTLNRTLQKTHSQTPDGSAKKSVISVRSWTLKDVFEKLKFWKHE